MDAEPQPPARPRLSVGVGAAVVLVLVVLVVTVAISALTPRGDSQVVGAATGSTTSVGGSTGGTKSGTPKPGAGLAPDDAGADGIFVHVLGAVARPGLYELREGDRVVDAVAAAGGYTEQADQAQLNLARVVTDGEQLYAPAVGELPPVPATSGSGGGAVGSGGGGSAGASGLVNLNTADSTQLETLPRVGPETAKKILDYREASGPFTSVEQLLEVPGIGQKTLDGLRDAVVL